MPALCLAAVPLVIVTLLALSPWTAREAYAQSPPATREEAQFDISLAEQPLEQALNALARQASLQLLVQPNLVAGKTAPAVSGRMTARQALDRLLAGTGLAASTEGGSTIVRPIATAAPAGAAQQVNVTAQQNRRVTSEGTGSYTIESTASATKLALTPRETPQTVAIIPRQVIDDLHLTDMRAILQVTPGIYVEPERNSQTYMAFARGHQLQTQYDGVPSPLTPGQRDTVSPDSAILDRVEVVQGAAGLLTGAGFPGGTVNLVRKMPTAERFGAGELSITSEGGYRGVVDVSGTLSSDYQLRGRLVAVVEDDKSFIDYVYQKKVVLYGVLETKLSADTQLALGINYEDMYDGSQGASFGNPTNIDGTPLDIPRSRNLGATWSDDDRTGYNAFLKLNQRLAGDWSLNANFSVAATRASALESSPYYAFDPATGTGIGLWAGLEAWSSNTLALDVYAEGPVELFGRRHRLMIGGNGSHLEADSSVYRESVQSLGDVNPFTWDPAKAPSPYSQPFTDAYPSVIQQTQQYGFFAGGRFSLADPLSVVAGARVSWYEVTNTGVRIMEENHKVTPYIGVVYDLNSWSSAYASYSEIFQPHDGSVKDKNGQVLTPITGNSYELGVKGEWFNGKLNAAAALFQLDQTNLAELDDSVPFDPTNICGGDCYFAQGLVRSTGVDLSIAGEVAPGWQVIGGYTTLKQQVERGADAGQPYNTNLPRQQFKLATTYTAPGGKWYAGVDVRYQSSIYREDLSWPYRIQQGAYTLVGLQGSYAFTPQISLQLVIDNLFNKSYLSGITDPNHGNIFGATRQATLTMNARF